MTTPRFDCARCGVNAVDGVRALNRDVKVPPLDLCGHHGREHGPALEKQKVWTIVPIRTILEAQERPAGWSAGNGTSMVQP